MVVTFRVGAESRAAISDALREEAEVVYLSDLDEAQRPDGSAPPGRSLSLRLGRELEGPEEFDLIAGVGLVQLESAGADGVPFERLAPAVPVASNAGAYAQPMAEHVLALTLALAKRLPQNQAALARGEFDQSTLNREIRGSVIGILGFGGIGRAAASLFTALGAHIHAVGREGRASEGVQWSGTLADLDVLLAVADVLVITLPLTRSTRGLIGHRELDLMKDDAILINPARAAIVDEDARIRAPACAAILLGGPRRVVAGAARARLVRHEASLLRAPQPARLSAQLGDHTRDAGVGGTRRRRERAALPPGRAAAQPARPLRVPGSALRRRPAVGVPGPRSAESESWEARTSCSIASARWIGAML